jgi:hypothetical protein
MVNNTQANIQYRLQKPELMLHSPFLEDWVMKNRMNLTFHASMEVVGPCYHKEG